MVLLHDIKPVYTGALKLDVFLTMQEERDKQFGEGTTIAPIPTCTAPLANHAITENLETIIFITCIHSDKNWLQNREQSKTTALQ